MCNYRFLTHIRRYRDRTQQSIVRVYINKTKDKEILQCSRHCSSTPCTCFLININMENAQKPLGAAAAFVARRCQIKSSHFFCNARHVLPPTTVS